MHMCFKNIEYTYFTYVLKMRNHPENCIDLTIGAKYTQ